MGNYNNKREINRYSAQKGAHKINRMKNISLRFLLALVIVFIFTAIFLVAANKLLFKIRSVEIISGGFYTEEQILEASGIELGGELFSADIAEINSRLKSALPYIKSSDITRVPPSTIKITIKLQKGAYGIKLGGDYYILSEDFYAIEKISAVNGAPPPEGDYILFRTSAVKKCVLGEELVFSDPDVAGFLRDIYSAAAENGIEGEIRNLDITNKFSVTADFGERFTVKFGSFENIGGKITNMLKIVEYLHETDVGVLDMTNDEKALFIR